jgi:Na+/proline symporter
MRKIIISAFILFVLIGLMLPASAGYEKKKYFEKHEKPSVDKDTNTAIVKQTQTAIPISIGNWNSAWFGSAGTQDIYQSQYSSIEQENEE